MIGVNSKHFKGVFMLYTLLSNYDLCQFNTNIRVKYTHVFISTTSWRNFF